MNYFSKRDKHPYFKAGLFSFLLLCGAQPAGAAVISASASIDWSTFKITPIDIGNGLPTLTWNSQTDSSCVGTTFCGLGSDYASNASNWSTGTSATESRATSIASASTSISQLNAAGSINDSPNRSLSTYSSSQRLGEFTVQGNGLLLFQANYSLAVDAGTAPGASGYSLVSFQLFSSNSNDGVRGNTGQAFYQNIHSGSPPVAEKGILGEPVIFQDGWTFEFIANTSVSVNVVSPNPVPLPTAFWLFGSALAGVAALQRSTIGQLKAA
jgi:hypothetical protein